VTIYGTWKRYKNNNPQIATVNNPQLEQHQEKRQQFNDPTYDILESIVMANQFPSAPVMPNKIYHYLWPNIQVLYKEIKQSNWPRFEKYYNWGRVTQYKRINFVSPSGNYLSRM